MADVTISQLEQIAELTDDLKVAIEGNQGNTSSATLSQILDFLHSPVQALTLSGSGGQFTVNPARNIIYTLDLSTINSTDVVMINLPAGSLQRESQVVIKIKNPNLATIRIPPLNYKLSMLNLTLQQFQLILDYDQSLQEWTAGTLPIERIAQ